MTQSATTPPETPMSLEWFQRGLDTTFDVKADGAEGALFTTRLVEVKTRVAPPGWEQFSALFIGPPSPVAPQGTYRFVHAVLGEIDLFMVPVGRETAGIQYEVCVARDTRTPAK